MSDRSDFIASMYQRDDEGDDAPSPTPAGAISVPVKGIMSMPAASAEIRRLNKQIEDQARAIKRLEVMMTQMRRHLSKQGTAIDAAHREIAGKMDSY